MKYLKKFNEINESAEDQDRKWEDLKISLGSDDDLTVAPVIDRMREQGYDVPTKFSEPEYGTQPLMDKDADTLYNRRYHPDQVGSEEISSDEELAG
jgi:hypothetical protein